MRSLADDDDDDDDVPRASGEGARIEISFSFSFSFSGLDDKNAIIPLSLLGIERGWV